MVLLPFLLVLSAFFCGVFFICCRASFLLQLMLGLISHDVYVFCMFVCLLLVALFFSLSVPCCSAKGMTWKKYYFLFVFLW